MSTWMVHWTMDGYVDIEARTSNEAMAKFDEMSSVEIMELGDHQPPEAYWAEDVSEDFLNPPAPMRRVHRLNPKEQYL